jgi:hypothetical protein
MVVSVRVKMWLLLISAALLAACPPATADHATQVSGLQNNNLIHESSYPLSNYFAICCKRHCRGAGYFFAAPAPGKSFDAAPTLALYQLFYYILKTNKG